MLSRAEFLGVKNSIPKGSVPPLIDLDLQQANVDVRAPARSRLLSDRRCGIIFALHNYSRERMPCHNRAASLRQSHAVCCLETCAVKQVLRGMRLPTLL